MYKQNSDDIVENNFILSTYLRNKRRFQNHPRSFLYVDHEDDYDGPNANYFLAATRLTEHNSDVNAPDPYYVLTHIAHLNSTKVVDNGDDGSVCSVLTN